MTKNQIDYWTFRELERANKAKEAETQRANVAQERERERSNRMSESISLYNVSESQRHNTEVENYNLMSLEEQARHNTVTEGEAVRSNVAREEENYRHNTATEGIQYISAGAQVSSASAQLQQAAEMVRHNTQSEYLQDFSNATKFEEVLYQHDERQRTISETIRSNMAREAETQRHNKWDEKIQLINAGVKAGGEVLRLIEKGLAAGSMI